MLGVANGWKKYQKKHIKSNAIFILITTFFLLLLLLSQT